MSAVLERTTSLAKPSTPTPARTSDWESTTGPVDSDARPRIAAPAFVYRGYGEAHWRGQTCHVIGSLTADERTIIMACGCQASVPWWTLEPIA